MIGLRPPHNPLAIPLLAFLIGLAGCEKATEPDHGHDDHHREEIDPWPEWEGPIFSVAPIPVDSLARITTLGHNNAIFPQPHTYWLTCDMEIVLPSERECRRARMEILSPGPGVVVDLNPDDDGYVRVHGPAGFAWTLGHVTPLVERGDTIAAGQPIATMYYDHGFDFGLSQLKDSITVGLANPERFPPFPPVHPVSQFEEPLRSELMAVLPEIEGDPFGRVYWDLPGTARGAWFLESAPPHASTGPAWADTNLYLGRFILRQSTKLMIAGEIWPAMPVGPLVVGSEVPDWEEITPATGRVAASTWLMGSDGLADPDLRRGSVLIEMLADDRLMIEWLPSDELPTEFTDKARIYTR